MSRAIVLLVALALVVTGCASATGTEEEGSGSVVETETSMATETVAETGTSAATETVVETEAPVDVEEVIEFEMRGAFDFFWEQANTDPDSPGFGLIRDRYPGSEGVASIASVGYGLTAYLIGIAKGYITYQDGYDRVNGTLDTLLAMDREGGFYYHFVDMRTGKRAWKCEVSNIDTSILLMGVLSAGECFGGEIQAKAEEIYDGVDWPWYLDESRDMFYMSYKPEEGFAGQWDFYAEQLMMYILAAGSDTHPVDDAVYYAFTRHYAKYGEGEPFIHSWFGSIFTYQFSHAWIDFRGYTDRKKVNWFDNSVAASRAQVRFAIAMDEKYVTLGPDAWGLTACDGPQGYEGRYGAPPSGYDNTQHLVDDTVAPSGAIGSILFVPEDALRAMTHYYTIDRLKGHYGFHDAYNLTEDWYATDVIGIDKGISLLMLANYQGDSVYSVVMKNEHILRGLERLGIVKGEPQ